MLLDGPLVKDLVLANVEQLDLGVDQLPTVFVRRDDKADPAQFGRLASDGGEDVIGLVAGTFQAGDAQRLCHPPHVGHLQSQILRHGGAIGFVVGEQLQSVIVVSTPVESAE